MRTTISIRESDLLYINQEADRREVSVSAVVASLVAKGTSRQTFRRKKFYSLIQYRPRSEDSSSSLCRVHVNVDELNAAFRCDVRSLFKISLSYLISLAVEEALGTEEVMDKYVVRTHVISFFDSDDRVFVEIQWGKRGKKSKREKKE